MRLIDADALREHFADMRNYGKCSAKFPDHCGEPSTNWHCVEAALANEPTVDAIPVEWLRDMMINSDAEESKAVWLVMREWKREHGEKVR